MAGQDRSENADAEKRYEPIIVTPEMRMDVMRAMGWREDLPEEQREAIEERWRSDDAVRFAHYFGI